MSKARNRSDQRALLAETARLVVEDGFETGEALRRAARKHGIRLQQAMPSPEVLQAAIREYRGLFRPGQTTELQDQRRLALQAMAEFSRFQPKLFGALLHGDGPLNLIQLLLTADTTELVLHHLADRHIPWQAKETVFSQSGGRRLTLPGLRFLAGETTVELAIIDHPGWSDPPRDPLSGGRLEMLGVAELESLLA